MSDRGAILYGGRPQPPTVRMPSYPNWQRKRIQNPYSVSSNLTEGTTKARSDRGFRDLEFAISRENSVLRQEASNLRRR